MFTEISIDNLRVFEQEVFRPTPGLNLVTGANGAGKTTLLEALHLVATGRSFRHRETNPLIREGKTQLQVIARILDSQNRKHVIGMRRERSDLVVRVDGRGNVKRSEILLLIPIHFIGADPQRLITGAPENRRGFLDSGLFHVEHAYLKLLQSYGRVLAQRNAALRSGKGNPRDWDIQLIDLGERISRDRRDYVEGLVPRILEILRAWSLDIELSFSYRNGWAKEGGFREALERALDTDRRQHFTSVGPHRADLVITGKIARSGKVLSRGQLKMAVVAMFLAQADVQRSMGREIRVLLLDDLGAELDRKNRGKVVGTIMERYPQVIATTLDPDDIDVVGGASMFHVEHGIISIT